MNMDLFNITSVDTTDSTSDSLHRLCNDKGDDVSEFTTLMANYQTKGKGQKGNSWESEKGKNLLFSYVFYPSFITPHRQFVVSQLAALAIKEELDNFAEGFVIKWPNDIYWHDKKICGMLFEVFLQGNGLGRCINGIGLNVNQNVFVSDAPNPVSLKQITGQETDRLTLLTNIMKRTVDYYERLKEDTEKTISIISSKYHDSLYRRTGMHSYRDKNGEFMAHILRVEEDGVFVLEDENGYKRRYLFKEVQFIV